MASIIKVDQIQTAAGGTPTAADLGLNTTGSVLQVVSVTTSTMTGTTTTSFTDTGLTASITPTSASSKILILVSQSIGLTSNSDNQHQFNLIITDSSNSVLFGGTGYDQFRVKNGEAHSWQTNLKYLDSPSTTDEVTYKTRMKMQLINGTTTLYSQYSSNMSSITLLEIAG